MDYEKAIDRVKKLLRLSQNAGSDQEAANAAARAAELMEEYQLSQAELRLADADDKRREEIVKRDVPSNARKKRVAWQSTIAHAVAESYGCKMYWNGPDIRVMGRESNVQAVIYTSQYLFREVDRLCDAAWNKIENKSEVGGGSYFVWEYGRYVEKPLQRPGRGWKNAFRVGAANTISVRLTEEREERRERAREDAQRARRAGERNNKAPEPSEIRGDALAIVERDEAEVEAAYETYSKGFGPSVSIGSTSSHDGYSSGREAGAGIAISGKRAGLGAGQGRLK